ncbi:MAG: DnaJ domain-containing protein [Aliidongia sp.]
MIYIIAVLLVIAALTAIISLLTRVQPKSIVRALWWGAGILVVLLGAGLLMTGRGALDVPLGLLFFYLRSGGRLPSGLVDRFRRWFGGGSGSAAASSAIETPWLRMTLDRATGALDGEVLAGRFAGAPLRQLDLDQLRTLHAECSAADEQSARLIEAYLDRLHPDWRDGPPPTSSGGMTRDEALQILGLQPGADAEQIREAHRRLMLKLHPDLGGSDYLAGKINLARDVLLDS